MRNRKKPVNFQVVRNLAATEIAYNLLRRNAARIRKTAYRYFFDIGNLFRAFEFSMPHGAFRYRTKKLIITISTIAFLYNSYIRNTLKYNYDKHAKTRNKGCVAYWRMQAVWGARETLFTTFIPKQPKNLRAVRSLVRGVKRP